MHYLYLAQLRYGNEKANQIVSDSFSLSQNTQEAWQRVWDASVDPTSPIWQAVCDFGLFIAGISLLYILVNEARNRRLDMDRFINACVPLVGIAIFLRGGGVFAAGCVLAIRSMTLYWMGNILNSTIFGINISDAIAGIQNTAVANARAKEIFAECVDKTGIALAECFQDPVKLEAVQELSNQLNGDAAPLSGNLIEQIQNGIASSIVSAINIPFINLMQFVLNVLQWCFANAIEATALLMALYCPISLGFSMVPAMNKSVFKWMLNFISLYLMQIGYVILVSLMAIVISLASEADQPLGSSFLDTAFLMFMAIFSWIIVIKVSRGTYDSAFEAISGSAKMGIDAGTAAVSGGSSLIAKKVAADMAAKTAKGA